MNLPSAVRWTVVPAFDDPDGGGPLSNVYSLADDPRLLQPTLAMKALLDRPGAIGVCTSAVDGAVLMVITDAGAQVFGDFRRAVMNAVAADVLGPGFGIDDDGVPYLKP